MYCHIPFTTIEISELFDCLTVQTCCPGWSPFLIKTDFNNLSNIDLISLWNSEIANLIRKGIRDGSYNYCSLSCPYLHKYRKFGKPVNIPYTLEYPQKIILSFDKACNLSCYHCRRGTPLINNIDESKMHISYIVKYFL